LWSDVRSGWQQRLQPRGNQRPPAPMATLLDAVDDAFESRIGDVSGRGKLGADMREIWLMQPRFDKRVGSSPFSLVDQPRFRAGFDFLRLRAQVGEVEEELAHWWETFQHVSDVMREDMVDAQRKEGLGASGAGKARRVKRSDTDHPPGHTMAPAGHDADGESDDHGAADDAGVGTAGETGEGGESTGAPKKRRRRRRKPAGGAADASDAGSVE
jgi:poly(A) polymerase